MTFNEAMVGVQKGDQLIIGEILQSSQLKSSIQITLVDRKDFSESLSQFRTSIIIATLSYVTLARRVLEDPDEAKGTFGMFLDGGTSEGNRDQTAEIVRCMNKSLGYMKTVWPKETRFARSLVRSVEVARICFQPDPMLSGQMTVPALFPEGWGGNVIRVRTAPSPRRRMLVSRDDGVYYFSDFDGCPAPEGAVISFGDFQLPVFNDRRD